MRIGVGVVGRRYGSVIIDVPDDSVILDANASMRKRKWAAQKMAMDKIAEDFGCIDWDDYDDPVSVEFGFMMID